MTNTVLVNTGMKILIEKLGNVDAEKFISLIIREPFDYTKWQRDLFEGMSIEEISDEAMKLYNKTYGI
ncbi:MAG: hypothetical protein HPY74_11850 [Firmicutes bacterium]|nr:hypothetical protein [Bacillota bacterium]